MGGGRTGVAAALLDDSHSEAEERKLARVVEITQRLRKEKEEAEAATRLREGSA